MNDERITPVKRDDTPKALSPSTPTPLQPLAEKLRFLEKVEWNGLSEDDKDKNQTDEAQSSISGSSS